MKHLILCTALGLVAFGAAAQEVGRVISSTPVVQQVAVPRTNCYPGQVAAQPMTSGMGGLGGAVVGGLLGSQIGHGNGQIAAGLVGTAIGAIVGNNMEANDLQMRQAATPTCTTETSYENRTVAYNVTYEYGGREYTTQMAYDPGPTVRLSAPAPLTGGAVTAPPVQSAQGTVQVVPAPVAPAPMMVAPVVVQQPYAVYPAYPAYPAYPHPVYRPYYPPVGVSLGFVFGGHRHHHHHRGHRHWR